MNEKIKCFFIGIGTALVGVLTFILGGVLRNRRATDTIGADLSRAERACREASGTNTELARTVERGQSILLEIRKQKVN